MSAPLLQIRNLTIDFKNGPVSHRATHRVSLEIRSGEVLALVGESGSGKSVTALAVTKLLPSPPAYYTEGEILFENQDVLKLRPDALRAIRGGRIAYVFQEPSTSLNPVFTIEEQIKEAIEIHRKEISNPRAEIIEALRRVGIQNPEMRLSAYPHELSGGMQQRVMIAMALACKPKLLIADEPTTALDVTIQAQVMNLLKAIRKETNMAILLITHNFGIIADFADRVAVMYRGQIVESGETTQILTAPQHPYTRALMACIPRLGSKQKRLITINYDEIQLSPS
ncbi:MAG: ABC transporter ATP-binding protein [Methylacidiphilales bacterium]|nr:ABC transporter ATP-binding protein [Candidatus Methylacidiphilales bacterium]MDW8348926.1 ABC transporter ATP-binding protein [Verrucomicrobiae bacterium]